MAKIYISRILKVIAFAFGLISCTKEPVTINYYQIDGVEARLIADTLGIVRTDKRDYKIISLIHKIESQVSQKDTAIIEGQFYVSKTDNLTDSIQSFAVRSKTQESESRVYSYKGVVVFYRNSESHDVYRLIKRATCQSGKCIDMNYKKIQELIDSKIIPPFPGSNLQESEIEGDSLTVDLN